MKTMKNILFALTITLLTANCAQANDAWRAKIDPAVAKLLKSKGTADVLVTLTAQADLSGAQNLTTKEEKGAYVYQQLTQTAQNTQSELLATLAAEGIAYRSFWAVNAVWLSAATTASIERLAQRADVRLIELDASAHLNALPIVPNTQATGTASRLLGNVTWGINKIKADQVWALGFTGQGVTVGGQDTGYSWEEAPIKAKYRGWNGTTANHNYNWHDAIHARDSAHYTDDNPYGYNLIVPIDDHGHGTHTAGTMAGATDTSGTSIGVAPNAKWIGCRNMERGWGMPSTYIECFQWFIAPTDLNNANPNTAKAPHVINNSWGCPPSEGCNTSNFSTMATVVANVKAAGIVVMQSAGNDGGNCSTVLTPAAIYEPAFSVGATDGGDGIAGFSSRGPVTVDNSNRRKPNVSAPGVGILSVLPGGGYAYWSGTSMAGPHVAGAVALLISARPALAGNVELIENILEQTAEHLTTTEGCGGDSPTASPNNTFGFGRIDILAAVQQAQTVAVSSNSVSDKPNLHAAVIPNPAQNQVFFQLQGWSGATEISLFATDGKQLQTETVQLTPSYTLQPISIASLPAGVYFYTVKNGAGSQTGRLVKMEF